MKFLRSDELSSTNNVIKMSGFTMVEMVWLFKTFGLEEPNTIIMHVGTNDMTQGVINTPRLE